MSNNSKIKVLRNQINELEIKRKNENNLETKAKYIQEEIILREHYTPLLLKKRPVLLIFGILFAIFYGISLMICLPPFIIRGKKRDINEEKIVALKIELNEINNQINSKSENSDKNIYSQEKEIEELKKQIDELKKQK